MTTIIYVCRKCARGPGLAEHLEARTDAEVRSVGCQKVCSHHVVGIRRRGERVVWLKKVDSKARRRAVRAYAGAPAGTALPKPLRRLAVERRRGRLRD